MARWDDKLYIYEVNTWVWLTDLSHRYGREITLANVPDEAIDDLARANVDMIWLMGVWKRSPFAQQNALKYRHEYTGALPDLTDADIIGSAYSIGEYKVDRRLGGRVALARLRHRLRERGLRLLLDYVPNHVGKDHPWIEQHPDYFIHGTAEDVKHRPSDFFTHTDSSGREFVIAHGRDPLFPGWEDTAQLNTFNPKLRRAVVKTLLDIADQCDGVRCDMAMLLMNDIFGATWGPWLDGWERPTEDYWRDIIPRIQAQHPDFLFIAEVYWDKEYDVLVQGFDYAYDKTLYDRIMENNPGKIRQHLLADIEYQQKMVRFVENHDEPRAYDRLGHDRSFPAATLICTLPGATLLHWGQFTGRIVKLPVQIRRQPDEAVHDDIEAFYMTLLEETRDPVYHIGQWYMFQAHSVDGRDFSHDNLIVYGWRELGVKYRLVVVNLVNTPARAFVPLGFWSEIAGANWALLDVINGKGYQRGGDEMTGRGLYIELAPYESHVFRFERVPHKMTTGEFFKRMTGELRRIATGGRGDD